MKPRKTWQEKLDDSKDLPRVEIIPERMEARWGEGTFVIPAPKEVNELMRRVPKGKLTTINELRAALAVKYSATIACPITTGIFAWISANAAEETKATRPSARITPYWRTLKTGGILNEKYPGGVAQQKRLLEEEGHTVRTKGKKYHMVDIDKSLFQFGS